VIISRPRSSLHHVEGGWFRANWHFSFDTYNDPENTWFGDLRVFNDDTLVPGAVWPMHPHRDIEGITYVAEGMFEHADSQGNGGILPPGSVQRATLGSGMEHSEGNHSKTEPMRFIQMWIIPREHGLPPSVEQRSFDEASREANGCRSSSRRRAMAHRMLRRIRTGSPSTRTPPSMQRCSLRSSR
jgi:redox-sensitive bicupin YhaK (pirin superfamily)